ncbi:Major facilitator superfamily domain-containing protein 6 [Stylophora pistillata]|uniref:Major facilitator superfamily domain-containing protein 6 n=1 Tax=Stylophora pistillata TaxID=50429 RepID=A0A2B4SZR9_STYPI|nr:Major facilitator superfamily domain-containing protein 6 [Stylophora pistillata]
MQQDVPSYNNLSAKACIQPFFPVFLRHVGLSAEQTGFVIGLQPLANFIGTPIAGALADKYRKHRIAMLIMCIVTTALQFSLVFVRPNEELNTATNFCSNHSFLNITGKEKVAIEKLSSINPDNDSSSFAEKNCTDDLGGNTTDIAKTVGSGDNHDVFLLIIVLSFVWSLFDGSNSLADAATVKYLTDIGRSGDYGKQRLWGAVGWGSIAILSGFTIDQSAQNSNQSQFFIAFCGFLLFNIAAFITVIKLPLEYLEGESKPKIFQNVCIILSDCCIVTFLLAILIMGASFSTIGTFLFWFIQDMNGSHLLMGLTLCMTCVSEVPVMFFSGKLIDRIGHHGVLYLTFVCYTIRYVLYSFIHNAWYILAVEPLHGVTFGAMWAATTSYGGLISPEGMRATVMSLVMATHFGLGKLIAGFGGGAIYDSYGPRILFRSLAVTSAITGLLFALSQRLTKWKSQVHYSGFQNDSQNDSTWDAEMKEINLDSGDEL